ncbi:DUF6084 family protein [Actinoplanes sp. CA-054009]
MSGGYDFSVLDVTAEPWAVAPQLTARLRIAQTTGERVHALALHCQVRIEPHLRTYTGAEEDGLLGLFGERARWGQTLRPFVWMQCDTTVQGFTGHTEADLALPCTYDLEVIGTRYLHSLEAGEVPLSLLFSGTVFLRGGSGFEVTRVPWDCEARYRLPVAVWRQMIESYFPGTGWLRLESGLLDELARFRAARGLTSWDETVRALLAAGGAKP